MFVFLCVYVYVCFYVNVFFVLVCVFVCFLSLLFRVFTFSVFRRQQFAYISFETFFVGFDPVWLNCGHSDMAHMTGARNHASHI